MRNIGRSLALTAGLLLLQACAPAPPAAPPADPVAPPAGVESGALGGRMLADAHEYPWSALARVNLAGQGFCTGVVIAPQQVLTQARCLYTEREGRWLRPLELHVIAAYQRDRFLADSKVAGFTVAPAFNPLAGSSLANIANNWAVVTLEEPIGHKTGWLGLVWDSAALQASTRLRAGFRQDLPHAVSLHFGCDEKADGAARLCQATPMELALPPFVIVDGTLRVMADFYLTIPREADPLPRLTGYSISDRRMGAAQPPARGTAVGRQPAGSAARLLAALGYDVSDGRLGTAAATFRRDNGLPRSEAIDMPLVGALLDAAYHSGK